MNLKRSDFITLMVFMALFTNLWKMARFSNKNGIRVKNFMKKNFHKILVIHSRLTSSLSNLTKKEKSKKRHKKLKMLSWKNNRFTKSK